MNERPLALSLANQILRETDTLGWLAPLAREYLKDVARDRVIPDRDVRGGLRESGPVHD
jgi:hypothetical protein